MSGKGKNPAFKFFMKSARNLVFVCCFLQQFLPALYCNEKKVPVKIGYFNGGRAHCLYRTYDYSYFKKEGVDVELYSQYLNKDKFFQLTQEHRKMMKAGNKSFGRVTGEKIIEAIENGILDGGTPGESSFIQAVAKGASVVAVALLGHDDKDKPGKALLLRKGLIINKPEDFKGKKFGTRRAGPADRIFLSEFFKSIGLDPEKDVTIIDQIPDNKQKEYLLNGKIDGIFHHLHGGIDKIEDGEAVLYRPMDWINPEVSHALLVFRKDFILKYPEKVEKIIRAYMKRIKYEKSLSEDERKKEQSFGYQIELSYEGMGLPRYDFPPLVRLDLLQEIQRLLLDYKIIDQKKDLSEFIDNSFVNKIYAELK